MARSKSKDVFWPVVGIDCPYPAQVQAALDLVSKEMKRISDEERAERQRERQAACQHERTERFIQRYANGDMCINIEVCEDCGLGDPPRRDIPAGIAIPIGVDVTLADGHNIGPFEEMLIEQASAVLSHARELSPREPGAMRKSISYQHKHQT
jgi:hypothetical protein